MFAHSVNDTFSKTVSSERTQPCGSSAAINASPDITAAHFAAIVNSSVDAIISKSLDGTVLSWNPAAERMFSYGVPEMIGQPVIRLFPPELVGEENASWNASDGASALSVTKPCA